MTVNQKFNFDLVDTDLVRLEQITNVEGIVNNVLDKLLEAGKESVGIQGANNTRNNEFLGSPTDGKRNRAQQTIGGIQLTETGTSS
jgi:hypothetical protein